MSTDYGSPELNSLLGGGTKEAAPISPAPAAPGAKSYGSPELDSLLGSSTAAPAPAPTYGSPELDGLLGAPKATSPKTSVPTVTQPKAPVIAPPAPKPRIPDNSALGVVKNTITGLPKAFWNFIGIGQIQDYLDTPEGQEAARNLSPGDVAKNVLPAAGKFVATPVADVAGIFTGAKRYNVPLIGPIDNIQKQTQDAVLNGMNPYEAVVHAAPQSIFDGLFIAGMAEKLFSPREQVVATGVKTNELPSGSGETPGTKSFRLSRPPATQSSPLPIEALEKLQTDGKVNFSDNPNFDANRPTYFKTTEMGNGQIKGEIVQLKPSIVSSFLKSFGGDISKVPENGLVVVSEQETNINDIRHNLAADTPEGGAKGLPESSGAPETALPTTYGSPELDTLLGGKKGPAEPTTTPPGEVIPPENPAIPDVSRETIPKTDTPGLESEVSNYKTADEFADFYTKNPEKIPTSDEYKKFLIEKDEFSKKEADIYQQMKDMRDKYAGKTLDQVEPKDLSTYNKKQEDLKDILSKKTLAEVPETPIKTHIGEKALREQLVDFHKNNSVEGAPIAKNLEGSPGTPTKTNTAVPKKKKPLSEEAKSRVEYYRGAINELKGRIDEHPGKTIQKFVSTKTGQFEDFKNPELAKTPQEAQRITARNARIMRSTQNAFDGTQYNDYFDNPDSIREAIAEYKDMKDTLSAYRSSLSNARKGIIDKSLQGGYIAPGKVLEAISDKAKAISKFLDDTQKKIEISGKTSDDLFKLEKNSQADRELAIQVLKSLPGTPKDYEAITHYIDDKSIELTPLQKEIYDKFVKPIQKSRNEIFNKLRDEKYPITSDDYSPRYVQSKGNAIDRLISSAKEKAANLSTGGKLSKSGPMMKHRVMRSITDDHGVRHVVAIKKGRVTELKNGERIDLGPLAPKISTKVKEFFDPAVREKLETLAKSLGIKHERVPTGRTEGLGGRRAGVSFQGENLIKTRLGPDSVLAHELGHQIDHKYGMQEIMKEEKYDALHRSQVMQEIRKLADERFAGLDVTPHFKSYVRQGSEKMAVMFEAYVSNRQMFQDIAPHAYTAFTDFMRSHAELKPFLDIKGSVSLGSKVHGGEFLRGRKGETFIDKNGKSYKIGEATIKEIEKNTNLTYHKNAIVNEMVSYLKLRQMERASEFVEDFKASPQFKEIAVESGQEAPAGWKPTTLPQFRGYMFEPRTAEVLNDFDHAMQEPGGVEQILGPVNRFLRDAIFFNPAIHIPNIGVHGAVNYGVIKLAQPSEYKVALDSFNKAFKAIITKNEDYIAALRAGAPMMSGDDDSRAVGKALLDKMAKEMEADPTAAEKVAKALNYANPALLIKAIYKFSGKATWLVNDLVTLQATYQDMADHGRTLEESIAETAKHIPDYRLPSRIFDKPLSAVAGERVGGNIARGLARTIGNTSLFMFGKYHYGALKSYGEMMKDAVSGGAEGEESKFSKEAWKERGNVADKLAMMALIGLVIYPYLLDKFAKKVTGNPNAKFRRAGAITFPYNVARLATGNETVPQFIQSIFTPTPILKGSVELGFNFNTFTGKPIYGPGGSGLADYLQNSIAPIQQANQIAKGQKSGIDFLASLGGISSPKNSDAGNAINRMVYDEKPALSEQVKQLISDGNKTQANALGYEFNQRLRAKIVEALKDKNMPTDDKTVNLYYDKSAFKLPGEKAMMNFASKPAKHTDDTVIGMALTYAKAIGTDPLTAFNRIFTGQRITRVTNGAVIVQRMSLSDSQQKKKSLGDPAGMTLDHIIPLELGGSNSIGNLKLVPEADAAKADKVENFLGDKLDSGAMTKDEVQKLIRDYKDGKITEAEVYAK